jgi:hypothetical protein
MRRSFLLLVLAAMFASEPVLAVEQCEKIQSMPIMYRHFACNKNVSALNFWASDLSPLERKAQPEYSGSCRKDRFAFKPHACVAEKRDPSDFVVIVGTFVNKTHFCNFTLPKQGRDNLLSNLHLQLGQPDPNGLQALKTSGPHTFDIYYAPLPPFGDALLTCDLDGGSCKLEAVAKDGESLFEIQFPGAERAHWNELLEKTQIVASKCV